jgi:hypothetical protein
MLPHTIAGNRLNARLEKGKVVVKAIYSSSDVQVLVVKNKK